jgi:predicted GNAT family acetyltransferase
MAEHGDSVKDAAVVHNASKQRFEIKLDGQLSVLEYTFKNYRLFLAHTEVPPALESQGLGTELAHAALEYARQNDLTVIAICPFVQDHVAGHPEYQSFVNHFGCLRRA